jgi:hypothetical protein
MNETDTGTIEERLARLERGLKRGKRAVTAMMVLLAFLLVWNGVMRGGKVHAAPDAVDLVAKSLKIVDEKGSTRVFLLVNEEGPSMFMTDEKRKIRVGLSVGKDGPVVSLDDEKEKPRVGLSVVKDVPVVSLRDERGKGSVGLLVDEDGPNLALKDQRGKTRVSFAVLKDNNPDLTLRDEKGESRVSLFVDKDGPLVSLRDERGKMRVGLVLTKDSPHLGLYDENENTRAVLGSTSLEATNTGETEVTAPSSLTLFDKEGKIIWRAP